MDYMSEITYYYPVFNNLVVLQPTFVETILIPSVIRFLVIPHVLFICPKTLGTSLNVSSCESELCCH